MSNFPVNNNPQHDQQYGNEAEMDYHSLLGALLESKWLILGVTLLGIALGVAKALTDTPIYKANALLQIQEKSKSLSTLESSADSTDNKSTVSSKIELLKSRLILNEAIKALHLDIQARPLYFPIIGQAIARQYSKTATQSKLAPPLFNQPDYAWGGESIKIGLLSVPETWLGSELTLVAGDNGRYRLMFEDDLILEGVVGTQSDKQLEGNVGKLSILVSELIARPGTRFSVKRLSENSAIDDLLARVAISEKGKGTDFLELAMESPDPELAMQAVNTIANIYLQKNIGNKSSELQKTTEFLDKQLSALKEKIEISTNQLNAYRSQHGSIDFGIETETLLKSIAEIQTQINELQGKRDEMRQKYTDSHPAVEAINKHIARLTAQIKSSNDRIETLPETQQTILKLQRDVKANTELYTTLLNNALSTKIAKEGAVGDSRVIDYAVVNKKPIRPQKSLIVVVATILGLALGMALAMIKKRFAQGVDNPNLIEKHLNLQVLASIPFTKNQERIGRLAKNADGKLPKPLMLALEHSDDLAIESLRNLRTNLHFTLLDVQHNIITITGPSPDIGKSFVALNLTAILADTGKKVLLIDADMRKGIINKSLAVRRGNGLSELIANQITLDQAINHIPGANFDFIATGTLPPNPSELLLNPRFAAFLETISKQYDHIIIDSPPIMAVTDAAIIGRLSTACLMVVKAGYHPMRELEQSIKRLLQARVVVKGVVFNGYIQSAKHKYGSGNYVYQYNYEKL